MPRPKRLFPVVRREIALPENLAAILETLFFDPVLGRAKQSAIPQYIISLIREDLKRRGLLK
jgi:hypothetical protein